MEPYLSIAALAGVATLTPGPNNAVILAAALRGGVRQVWPTAVAISLMTAASILLAGGGLALVPHAMRFAPWMELAAALLLGLMAAHGLAGAGSEAPAKSRSPGALVMAAAQVLNPKAWVLAVSIASAASAQAVPLSGAAGLSAVIALGSMTAWIFAGAAGAAWLQDEARSRRASQFGSLAILAMASLMALSSLKDLT